MANLVYNQPGTALTWLNTGGTELLTLTSVVAGAGRQGALHDFGAVTAKASTYEYRAWVKVQATPAIGETIDLYQKTSDGTRPDNDDGTGDIALSDVNKLLNLDWFDAIAVDEVSASVLMVKSGLIQIRTRFWGPIFLNNTAATLSATATDHGFSLTPVPDEIQ